MSKNHIQVLAGRGWLYTPSKKTKFRVSQFKDNVLKNVSRTDGVSFETRFKLSADGTHVDKSVIETHTNKGRIRFYINLLNNLGVKREVIIENFTQERDSYNRFTFLDDGTILKNHESQKSSIKEFNKYLQMVRTDVTPNNTQNKNNQSLLYKFISKLFD